MKPGPAISALCTPSSAASLGTISSASARGLVAGVLGEHHRGVGREIAVRRIARRLDRDGAAIEPGRQRAFGLERVEDGSDMGGEAGVKGQMSHPI